MKKIIMVIVALFTLSACVTVNPMVRCKTQLVGPEKNTIEICK